MTIDLCQRWFFALGLVVLFGGGCTRSQYRQQADKEVYNLVGCAAQDPRWQLRDYTIKPNPASRYYDPFNPDRPPMPPDDPTSHQLMLQVDGKKGYKHWDRNGCTRNVENPKWLDCLSKDDDGAVVLDRPQAMRVAIIQSREYQRRLEDLYLSALDVTFQRFRFDAQFFGRNSTFFDVAGPAAAGGSSRSLSNEMSTGMTKLGAAGGTLAVDLANSLVWQFAGPDDYQARSILDFSLVQPLIRGAGRAVVMENLTESERILLANVRQMDFFRQTFYTQIVAGRAAGAGPFRGGVNIEGLLPNLPGATGGILSLLGEQVRIRNQRANVTGLRDSLDQIEAHYDAGRIDRLQVDIARQALYNAQIQLLALDAGYEDRLDAYKITLGLPPDLKVKIHDALLEKFDLVDPQVTATSEAVSALLADQRTPGKDPPPLDEAKISEAVATDFRAAIVLVETDVRKLDEILPRRRQDLNRLARREEIEAGEVDLGAISVDKLDARAADLRAQFATVSGDTQATLEELGALKEGQPQVSQDETDATDDDMPARSPLLPLLVRVSDHLLALSLIQASARLESVTLVQVEMAPPAALQTARQNRLDWMNARAALVDNWRRIEVKANALRSDVNVVLSGDVSTTGNDPLRFRGTTGRLRAGVQFDAPLTRLVERNAYVESLIEYQRARRAYYAFEDRVNQSLRSTLRSIRQSQLDFELRRAGVYVAISQVDITRERLQRPPRAGEQLQPGQSPTFGATTARDLVQAYSGLLSAQNDFLTAWVNYEVDRLNLDQDLGTMRLDADGSWIDPGPIEAAADEAEVEAAEAELIPEPAVLESLLKEEGKGR